MSGKGKLFWLGLGSGALLASNWQTVVKRGVQFGVKGGSRLQGAVLRGVENVSDVTREALSEIDVPKTSPPDGDPAAG